MAKEKKQFRQLSDEELERVTGGASIISETCLKNPSPDCFNKVMAEPVK